ncbi:tRNA dihydrouridine synthase DusB [Fusibacter sp. JL216-2]|uniref:tRNA dihydrouridine synthase DusB n=1 Tax=Fusibacter sp. JL216-2 TaxID=3071453 RepID=UPI003D3386E8
MKIGNVKLSSPVILGPMAGVTDLPFRLVCMEYGAGLLVTEMVSAKALHYKDKKTARLMEIREEERPVALQLFGSDPDIMGSVVEQINDHNHDILDINMGCPAPKIVNNGDGSALMKTPDLAKKVIEAVVKASSKPVTVKIRKGWDADSINAVQIASIAQEAGVAAVAVHGRTRDQFYTGKADWGIIKEVKDALTIPVIGNGDIFSIEDAIQMREQTGCDGLMIARGAQGNPWLLKQVSHYLNTGERLPHPTREEKIREALRHFDLLVDFKGDHIGVLEMRKHAAWYLKGIRGGAVIRNEINTATNPDMLRSLLLKAIE